MGTLPCFSPFLSLSSTKIPSLSRIRPIIAMSSKAPDKPTVTTLMVTSPLSKPLLRKPIWAKLGQRLNVAGMLSFLAVILRDQELALPHLRAQDLRWVNWAELKRQGFEGVVLDKDNTLTAPYSFSLWPGLGSSLDQCKSVFKGKVALFSNSSGLLEYDSDGSEAKALEKLLGVHVIRHGTKKPAGTAEEIEKYFNCEASQLVMVGDRYFTDVVFGNRNGFLTILTQPLSLAEEPLVVKQVRKLEAALVSSWYQKGLQPRKHSRLSDESCCVQDPAS
ncbi:hypothetical protein AMTRI_Chr02g213600 [Amborella trichopoda]